jgi:hypothetical protein
MRRQYPPHFRRDMVNLMLAEETSVPKQTLHPVNHQALVDQGLVEGLNSAESAQLRAPNKGIKALET